MPMSWEQARQERRQLKQQLFQIRRYLEGEIEELTAEQEDLRAEYEALPGFTSWHDFPDRWDIGDPNHVKAGAQALTPVDEQNFARIAGRPYAAIVPLITEAGTNVGEEQAETVEPITKARAAELDEAIEDQVAELAELAALDDELELEEKE